MKDVGHDDLVHRVYEYLSEQFPNDFIRKFEVYGHTHCEGELDIFRVDASHKVHYYEIKGTRSECCYAKALEQLERFHRHYRGSYTGWIVRPAPDRRNLIIAPLVGDRSEPSSVIEGVRRCGSCD